MENWKSYLAEGVPAVDLTTKIIAAGEDPCKLQGKERKFNLNLKDCLVGFKSGFACLVHNSYSKGLSRPENALEYFQKNCS